MTLYVAVDVSLEKTAVCVMDAEGTVIVERVVPSEAAELAALITDLPEPPERIGLEAGPLSEWLARGLAEAGFTAVLMETRQIRAALSSMTVKTDHNDARGMAHLLRIGWCRPVHLKSLDGRAKQRTLLSARTTLVRRLRDIENSCAVCCGVLDSASCRCCGPDGHGTSAKLSLTTRCCLRSSTRRLTPPGHCAISSPFWKSAAGRRVSGPRLPPIDHHAGIGAVIAFTFRAAVDRPDHFSSSKAIGPCFGLTPRRYQSGETDRTGAISRATNCM